jgi:hypothetical protein
VVIPLSTQHYPMLQRNLVYTGVTRGKRLVVLLGQLKALAIAVSGARKRRRWSKLREWLALDASPEPVPLKPPKRSVVAGGNPSGGSCHGRPRGPRDDRRYRARLSRHLGLQSRGLSQVPESPARGRDPSIVSVTRGRLCVVTGGSRKAPSSRRIDPNRTFGVPIRTQEVPTRG